jgi:predicted DNA-binding transcriptional regulator YafY
VSVTERRAEILRILRGVEQTTIPRLAQELGASVSTIKRDILALTVDDGYPINTAQGNGGGVSLTDYRHPHKRIFSQEQISVLVEITLIVDTYRAEVIHGILRAYAY